jgi:hypothetical protein
VGGDTTIRRGGRVAVSDGSDDDRQQLRGPPLGLAGDRGVTPDVFVILTRSNLRSLPALAALANCSAARPDFSTAGVASPRRGSAVVSTLAHHLRTGRAAAGQQVTR